MIRTNILFEYVLDEGAVKKHNLVPRRPLPVGHLSDMFPMLSGQTSIFGLVFFVSKSLLGIEGLKKKLKKIPFSPEIGKPHSMTVRVLIHQTWLIFMEKQVRVFVLRWPIWD